MIKGRLNKIISNIKAVFIQKVPARVGSKITVYGKGNLNVKFCCSNTKRHILALIGILAYYTSTLV